MIDWRRGDTNLDTIGLILNPRSGYVAAHGLPYVRAQITTVLPEVRIHVLQPGDDVAARCRDLIADGAICIVAAGGDGTVSAVASHLVGTDIPLGVIPAGTLNHLARDVGVGPTSPRLCACWPAAIPCRWTWPGSMGASS